MISRSTVKNWLNVIRIKITWITTYFTDEVQPTSGTCYTTADSPTNPNQPCILPFKFNGRLIEECLVDRDGEKWCSTKVDEFQEHVSGNWGYCSTSCSKNVTKAQFNTGATFSDKNIAWKSKLWFSFLSRIFQFSHLHTYQG